MCASFSRCSASSPDSSTLFTSSGARIPMPRMPHEHNSELNSEDSKGWRRRDPARVRLRGSQQPQASSRQIAVPSSYMSDYPNTLRLTLLPPIAQYAPLYCCASGSGAGSASPPHKLRIGTPPAPTAAKMGCTSPLNLPCMSSILPAASTCTHADEGAAEPSTSLLRASNRARTAVWKAVVSYRSPPKPPRVPAASIERSMKRMTSGAGRPASEAWHHASSMPGLAGGGGEISSGVRRAR